MKKKYIFNAVIVALAVLVFLSMIFSYIQIKPSDYDGIQKTLLEYILKRMDIDGNSISWSALNLIHGAEFGETVLEIASDELSHFMTQVKIFFMLPYIMAVVVIVFGLLKMRWSYIVTAVVSFISPAILSLYTWVIVPQSLANVLDDVLDTKIARRIFKKMLGDDAASKFRQIVFKSLGPGYWIIIFVFAAIMILSIVAFFLVSEEKEATKNKLAVEDTIWKEPGIICMCGQLNGAKLPMEPGDEIVVGRNTSMCNLIIDSTSVSRRHMSIRYVEDKNQYIVMLYADAVIDDCVVRDHGTWIPVKRGGRIMIGRERNLLLLD